MNRRSPLVMMSFVAVAVALSGCSASKEAGTISVHTYARSDAKGPWSKSVIIVNGRGFTPNRRFDLAFRGLPSAPAQPTSWRVKGLASPVSDAEGSFVWSIPIVSASSSISSYSHAIASLPPLDYDADPSGEVTVTVSESRGPWAADKPLLKRFISHPPTAQTSIKTGDLIAAPFEGTPADTSQAPAK